MQITWFMGKKSFRLLVAAIVGCVQDIGEYEDTWHPWNVTDKKVKSAGHELLIIWWYFLLMFRNDFYSSIDQNAPFFLYKMSRCFCTRSFRNWLFEMATWADFNTWTWQLLLMPWNGCILFSMDKSSISAEGAVCTLYVVCTYDLAKKAAASREETVGLKLSTTRDLHQLLLLESFQILLLPHPPQSFPWPLEIICESHVILVTELWRILWFVLLSILLSLPDWYEQPLHHFGAGTTILEDWCVS